MKIEICFATNNKGKLAEIQAAAGDNYKILSLSEIGCNEDLPENQETIEGNSKEKAEYVFNKYHVNCFADDTGLEVEALNGEPGVYSARYAGSHCSSEDNMNLLLEKLKGVENRRARFKTVISLIMDGKLFQFEGVAEGEILSQKKGDKGFGYDPVFKPAGFEKTFAELSIDEKNKFSHRGKAVSKMIEFLKTLKQ